MSEPPRALCLAGPTGAGKSALALALAERIAVEIISVDSAQVYRGMDIGTAKPGAAERAAVPHHLIDIRDPAEPYSAAAFRDDANRLIEDIRGRGRMPLLVGGTMLYFKVLREGLDAMPAADPQLRAAIEAEAAERGWTALHGELARVDPTAAARLASTDSQRIQRALEVWRVSGRPWSEWATLGHGARPAAADLPLVALEPRTRAWLHQRIDDRFALMLRAGLVDEVKRLRARGDLHAGSPSMRAVGYRQVWAALDGAAPHAPGAGPPDALAAAAMNALHARGSAATRQLAKRQLTWLRSMPSRIVIACDDAQALRTAPADLVAIAHG